MELVQFLERLDYKWAVGQDTNIAFSFLEERVNLVLLNPTSTVVAEKSFFRKYFGRKLGPWTDVVCLGSHGSGEFRRIKS